MLPFAFFHPLAELSLPFVFVNLRFASLRFPPLHFLLVAGASLYFLPVAGVDCGVTGVDCEVTKIDCGVAEVDYGVAGVDLMDVGS